jgi:hypothetical protein
VDYYGEDVAATEQLLGQSLPWYVQRTQTL